MERSGYNTLAEALIKAGVVKSPTRDAKSAKSLEGTSDYDKESDRGSKVKSADGE